jgi:hypothetical protein
MTKLLPDSSSCRKPNVPEELRPLALTLIDLEEQHHEIGWDNLPPMLYMLSEPEDGNEVPEVTGARLGLQFSPREELVRMAGSMQILAEIAVSDYKLDEERMRQLRAVYGTPSLGHAVVMESWVCIPGETTTDMDAVLDCSPGDIPGSLEARFAYLAMENKIMVVSRVRDERPEFGCYEPGGSVTFGGQMLDALIVYDKMARTVSRNLKEVAA